MMINFLKMIPGSGLNDRFWSEPSFSQVPIPVRVDTEARPNGT